MRKKFTRGYALEQGQQRGRGLPVLMDESGGRALDRSCSIGEGAVDEKLPEHVRLDRLLENRNLREAWIDARTVVAGHEDEGDLAPGENFGDRVNGFSAEIDVEDGGTNIFALRGRESAGEVADRAYDGEPEFSHHLLEHGTDQRFVFDHEDASTWPRYHGKRGLDGFGP